MGKNTREQKGRTTQSEPAERRFSKSIQPDSRCLPQEAEAHTAGSRRSGSPQHPVQRIIAAAATIALFLFPYESGICMHFYGGTLFPSTSTFSSSSSSSPTPHIFFSPSSTLVPPSSSFPLPPSFAFPSSIDANPPPIPSTANADAPSSQQTDDEVIEIRKAYTDKREYRYMTLSNGMKVLLIADAACDEAAASIRVAAGSAADPPHLPGLAHFTEHMLFQGSKQYPRHTDYFDYIHKHGGHANAYTSKFSTVFSFAIIPAFLQPALERMADAFAAPLLSKTQMEKEVNAVHAEYQIDINDDGRRAAHLVRQSEKETPFSRFTVGNLESLSEQPKRKGIDLQEEMRKFHDRWYSSNLMTLAVVGAPPLSKLEVFVRSRFEKIPNKKAFPPSYEECSNSYLPLTASELSTQTFAVPEGDRRDARFVFYLPPQAREWKEKPLHYLSFMLGNEGPGSLASKLKNEKLVSSLFVSSSSPELCTIFQVGVHLTEAARNQKSLDRIGYLLFLFLRALAVRPPEPWRLEELQRMRLLSFFFAEMPRAYDLSEDAVEGLHYYPPSEVLAGDTLLYSLNATKSRDYINAYICPSKVRLFVFDKQLAKGADRMEHWFRIKHRVSPVPSKTLQAWEGLFRLSAAEVWALMNAHKMHFPPRNYLIPQRLTFYNVPEQDKGQPLVLEVLHLQQHEHSNWRQQWRPRQHAEGGGESPQEQQQQQQQEQLQQQHQQSESSTRSSDVLGAPRKSFKAETESPEGLQRTSGLFPDIEVLEPQPLLQPPSYYKDTRVKTGSQTVLEAIQAGVMSTEPKSSIDLREKGALVTGESGLNVNAAATGDDGFARQSGPESEKTTQQGTGDGFPRFYGAPEEETQGTSSLSCFKSNSSKPWSCTSIEHFKAMQQDTSSAGTPAGAAAAGAGRYPTELIFSSQHICHNMCRIFHKLDDRFHTPRVIIELQLYYHSRLRDPLLERLLTDLYFDTVSLAMREHLYTAAVAGISFSLRRGVYMSAPGLPLIHRDRAITLYLSGYVDQLLPFLASISGALDLRDNASENRSTSAALVESELHVDPLAAALHAEEIEAQGNAVPIKSRNLSSISDTTLSSTAAESSRKLLEGKGQSNATSLASRPRSRRPTHVAKFLASLRGLRPTHIPPRWSPPDILRAKPPRALDVSAAEVDAANATGHQRPKEKDMYYGNVGSGIAPEALLENSSPWEPSPISKERQTVISFLSEGAHGKDTDINFASRSNGLPPTPPRQDSFYAHALRNKGNHAPRQLPKKGPVALQIGNTPLHAIPLTTDRYSYIGRHRSPLEADSAEDLSSALELDEMGQFYQQLPSNKVLTSAATSTTPQLLHKDSEIIKKLPEFSLLTAETRNTCTTVRRPPRYASWKKQHQVKLSPVSHQGATERHLRKQNSHPQHRNKAPQQEQKKSFLSSESSAPTSLAELSGGENPMSERDADAVSAAAQFTTVQPLTTETSTSTPLLQKRFLGLALERLETELEIATLNRSPGTQATDAVLELLLHPYLPVHALRQRLKQLQEKIKEQISDDVLPALLQAIRSWASLLWRSAAVEGIIQGNIRADHAAEVIQALLKALPLQQIISSEEILQERVLPFKQVAAAWKASLTHMRPADIADVSGVPAAAATAVPHADAAWAVLKEAAAAAERRVGMKTTLGFVPGILGKEHISSPRALHITETAAAKAPDVVVSVEEQRPWSAASSLNENQLHPAESLCKQGVHPNAKLSPATASAVASLWPAAIYCNMYPSATTPLTVASNIPASPERKAYSGKGPLALRIFGAPATASSVASGEVLAPESATQLLTTIVASDQGAPPEFAPRPAIAPIAQAGPPAPRHTVTIARSEGPKLGSMSLFFHTSMSGNAQARSPASGVLIPAAHTAHTGSVSPAAEAAISVRSVGRNMKTTAAAAALQGTWWRARISRVTPPRVTPKIDRVQFPSTRESLHPCWHIRPPPVKHVSITHAKGTRETPCQLRLPCADPLRVARRLLRRQSAGGFPPHRFKAYTKSVGAAPSMKVTRAERLSSPNYRAHFRMWPATVLHTDGALSQKTVSKLSEAAASTPSLQNGQTQQTTQETSPPGPPGDNSAALKAAAQYRGSWSLERGLSAVPWNRQRPWLLRARNVFPLPILQPLSKASKSFEWEEKPSFPQAVLPPWSAPIRIPYPSKDEEASLPKATSSEKHIYEQQQKKQTQQITQKENQVQQETEDQPQRRRQQVETLQKEHDLKEAGQQQQLPTTELSEQQQEIYRILRPLDLSAYVAKRVEEAAADLDSTPPTNMRLRVRMPSWNIHDQKNQVHLLIEIGPITSIKERALLYLIHRWMGQEFFNRMRTDEQLGYLTSMHVDRLEHTYYYLFTITTTYDPVQVAVRMTRFLRLERRKFMTPHEFQHFQQAAIDVWKQRPKSLSHEVAKFLREIVLHDYIFDLDERVVEELRYAVDKQTTPLRFQYRALSVALRYPAHAANVKCLWTRGLVTVGAYAGIFHRDGKYFSLCTHKVFS